MSGQWKVAVDRDRCIGSGLCAGTAPDYFALVDKKSTPLRDLVDPDESVSDAADCCPVEAILVTDPTTGDTIAPV
ncbi:ferredoxin [Catellatospora vulcania]|uniref:ferredoxin n=1 Tax=Catellatospora vulcania TaxID=1460450 RepID=UPI0012D4C35A|nr:ferredoxin [Catellatospora vulcania]